MRAFKYLVWYQCSVKWLLGSVLVGKERVFNKHLIHDTVHHYNNDPLNCVLDLDIFSHLTLSPDKYGLIKLGGAPAGSPVDVTFHNRSHVNIQRFGNLAIQIMFVTRHNNE